MKTKTFYTSKLEDNTQVQSVMDDTRSGYTWISNSDYVRLTMERHFTEIESLMQTVKVVAVVTVNLDSLIVDLLDRVVENQSAVCSRSELVRLCLILNTIMSKKGTKFDAFSAKSRKYNSTKRIITLNFSEPIEISDDSRTAYIRRILFEMAPFLEYLASWKEPKIGPHCYNIPDNLKSRLSEINTLNKLVLSPCEFLRTCVNLDIHHEFALDNRLILDESTKVKKKPVVDLSKIKFLGLAADTSGTKAMRFINKTRYKAEVD